MFGKKKKSVATEGTSNTKTTLSLQEYFVFIIVKTYTSGIRNLKLGVGGKTKKSPELNKYLLCTY